MTPHPQAEILQAVADGGEIEAFYGKEWYDVMPMTVLRYIYDGITPLRIKPKTININGIEVPEPMREEPEFNTEYWVADPVAAGGAVDFIWQNMAADERWLSLGICHLTQEAAAIHANALLSFTRKTA